jgi:hypothetical protein
VWILTRYFLDNLFGRQVLDEEGIMGLRRVLIFAATGAVSIALYVPRVLHKKYADLDALVGPEPYRQALVSDTFLMICLIVMLAAFIAALVAPAMFPTEVDYVTLTPLPISRRRIFGAKVAAVLIFAGTLILSVVVFFAFSFPLFTHSRWSEHTEVLRITSLAVATAGGATFAFLGVMAVQGLILTVLPRGWVTRASMLLQSAAIAGLILMAPFVFGLASPEAWRRGWQPEWLLFPPAWFLGVEQMLLGREEVWIATLGRIGLIGPAIAAAVTMACYGWLYRKPERLASLPPKSPAEAGLTRRPADMALHGPKGPTFGGSPRTPSRHGSAWTAVWVFLTSTLARNRLPQLVFLIAWAVGLAIVASSLQNGLRHLALPEPNADWPMKGAAVDMPFVLMVLSVAGLRAAFLLPISLPANWMFRVTDFPKARSERLDAVEQAFLRLAILPALAIAAPVQIWVLGVGRGLLALLVATLYAAVILEFVLIGWRRVPFTCTWLPGKRPLPFALLAVLGVYLVTGSVAGFTAHTITTTPRGVVGLSVMLAVIAVVLRWGRKRSWARDPLEFEDEPFDRVQRLGLGPS